MTDRWNCADPPGIVHLILDAARYPAAAAALAAVTGTALAPPGRVEAGVPTTVWQGPRDWLVLCERAAAAGMARDCRAALAAFPALANDVSAGLVVLAVEGEDAPAILAGGTGIDLDTAAFPPGASAVTRFADVRVTIVHRPDAPGAYHLFADRSRAAHLCRWLADAAHQRD